jgi:L,D-peptidoglycan transpeptidase YkuD (ErfK/YbiS/YcfS/YnhG family)
MTTVTGGATGAIIAQANAEVQKVDSVKQVSSQQVATSFEQRTKGSVFNAKFGDYSHLAKAGLTPPNKMGVANQSSGAIGNLLAGNFGDLSARRGTMPANTPQLSKNTDQDQTQTSDEMLDIANNLTMKDMWAAA